MDFKCRCLPFRSLFLRYLCIIKKKERKLCHYTPDMISKDKGNSWIPSLFGCSFRERARLLEVRTTSHRLYIVFRKQNHVQ